MKQLTEKVFHYTGKGKNASYRLVYGGAIIVAIILMMSMPGRHRDIREYALAAVVFVVTLQVSQRRLASQTIRITNDQIIYETRGIKGLVKQIKFSEIVKVFVRRSSNQQVSSIVVESANEAIIVAGMETMDEVLRVLQEKVPAQVIVNEGKSLAGVSFTPRRAFSLIFIFSLFIFVQYVKFYKVPLDHTLVGAIFIILGIVTYIGRSLSYLPWHSRQYEVFLSIVSVAAGLFLVLCVRF